MRDENLKYDKTEEAKTKCTTQNVVGSIITDTCV